MKQILQNLNSGETYLEEVAVPAQKKGALLIGNTQSLISLGTEKMLMNFGKANLLEKAQQQPDKVKQVLDKVKTDGLLQTYDAVKSKLSQPLPLGYSAVGTVIDPADTGFSVGDRVISNGHHAEYVRVSKHLCAKVPGNVSDEEAAFTVVSAIALQGVRILSPTLGEKVVVVGLGLIGLITAQILRANGCEVLGVDFSESKVNLAKELGFQALKVTEQVDVVAEALAFSKDIGVDGVIITASTQSNDPVHQAAQMSRKRGKIVLVGVVGLQLSRDDFYEKELSFQVSCSYGPGRYDANYEEKGQDYPIGFVRWTEQRNFEAVLALMSSGQLDVKPLISHRFEFLQAESAYQQIAEQEALGVLLSYPTGSPAEFEKSIKLATELPKYKEGDLICAVLGAGNYAGRVLIPAFQKAEVKLNTLVSSGGLSSTHFGNKFNFVYSTTDAEQVYSSEQINMLVIATQHNLHADQVVKGIKAKKHVFIEKPLALTFEEIDTIESKLNTSCLLTVGFNRRFAPHTKKIKSLLSNVSAPKSFIMTVNAGSIPEGHWTQEKTIGGGRIIGEACHFVDLLRYLAGHQISTVSAQRMGEVGLNDNATINLSFADGSIGSIHYFANGGSSFAKERLEVFAQGGVLQLDNFIKLKGYNWSGFSKMNLWKQDKGHEQCVKAFVNAIKRGSEPPIPYDEILEVSRITIKASLQLEA